MSIQYLKLHRALRILRAPELTALSVRLAVSALILACFIAGIGFLSNVSAQYDATMSFGVSGDSSSIQFVDPDGENSVPFWTRTEYPAIDFTLYPLSETEFLNQNTYLEWYTTQPIDVTGLISTTTWSTEVPIYDYQSYNRTLSTPIAIPEEIPAGIYVIQADAPDGNVANAIIVISRNVLVLKRGSNDQVVAWVSALQDGKPAVEMEVTLYDLRNDTIIDQRKTDEKGVAEFDLNGYDSPPIIAIASHPTGDITLAGLGGGWYDNGHPPWKRIRAQDPYRLYLYTDRPLYRPGQTIYFDAIARNYNLEGISPVAPSTEMSFGLRDSRNKVVDYQALTADEYGKANGSFTLGDEVVLGNYTLILRVGHQAYYQTLQVEEFAKPEYSVEVSTPKSFAIEGDSVPVTVDAAYFFGQPVADAQVKLKIYRQRTYNYYWWSNDDYNSPYWYENTLIDTLEGVTDDQGQWTTLLEPSADGNNYGATYAVVAEVTDGQEKAVHGQHKFEVHFNESNAMDISSMNRLR